MPGALPRAHRSSTTPGRTQTTCVIDGFRRLQPSSLSENANRNSVLQPRNTNSTRYNSGVPIQPLAGPPGGGDDFERGRAFSPFVIERALPSGFTGNGRL